MSDSSSSATSFFALSLLAISSSLFQSHPIHSESSIATVTPTKPSSHKTVFTDGQNALPAGGWSGKKRRANLTLLAIYGKLGGSGSSDVTHGLHEVSATDPFEVRGALRLRKRDGAREGGGGQNRPREEIAKVVLFFAVSNEGRRM